MRLFAFLASAALVAAVPAVSMQAAAPAAAQSTQEAALAAFFEAYDAKLLAMSPTAKTARGIRDADYGRWNDDSPAAREARYALGQEALAEMRRRFDPAKLQGQSLLSYRLFERQMERAERAWAFRDYDYAFDQMNGAQSQLPAFLINQHRVASKAEAEAYVRRLAGMGTALDQAIAQGLASEKLGVVPPRWTFPYVIADSRNIITGAPFGPGPDSPLWADFKGKVERLDLPAADKAELLARGEAALKSGVQPGYERLIAFAEGQQARACWRRGVALQGRRPLL